MKQKIVFFGSGWFVIPVIAKLVPHGLDLVITTEKEKDSPVIKYCNQNNIRVMTANTASDLINHQSLIINHSLAILASFGAFVPDEIINAFPNGIINIHPSLLPKYKGPSPIQYQLLNGETTVGVTLIKLDSEIDHGPILSQKPYQLTGNETSEDLLSILFEIGADLVVEEITKLENNQTLTETPQVHSQESWSYKIEKKDGMIDPYSQQPTTYNLNNMIRAYYPWPGVWFKCHPEHSEGSKLSGKIIKLLPEGKIQVEGKNPMNYKDFINGFGEEGKELLEKLNLD